jgi:hypothetical protein
MTSGQTPLLSYGPPARSERRWIYVLIAGAITTAATLAISWAIEHYSDFTLMGLYLAGIIPVGAFLVGMGAASGYAIAALALGVRIRRPLLLMILGITVVAYCAMYYIIFLSQGPLVYQTTGARVTFPAYFDAETRAIHFKSTDSSDVKKNDTSDDGLGIFGYGVRLLEFAAFSLGALATPVILWGRKYCDLCERYYGNYRLAAFPAAATKSAFRSDEALSVEARNTIYDISRLIESGDAPALNQILQSLKGGSRSARRKKRHVNVRLTRCDQCGTGVILLTLVVNERRTKSTRELRALPVDAAFADALRPRRSKAT